MTDTNSTALSGIRAPGQATGMLTLLDVLERVAAHKRLVIGLTTGVTFLAVLVSLLLPALYTATVRVLPPQQSGSTATALLGQLTAFSAFGLQSLKSPTDLYVGLLKSRTIADSIAHRFELHKVYNTDTLHDTRKTLQTRVLIAAGRDGIIAIDFDDEDPKRAAAIANAYVEELQNLMQSLAVSEASQRRLFFEKQLNTARDALANAEVNLKKTQEVTGLIKLDEQGKAIIESVARLRAQVAAKEVELSVMSSYATRNNPDLIRGQEQLAGLKTQLARLESSTALGNGSVFLPTGRVPEAGLEYMRRVRDLKYHEAIFEVLAKQYEIARIDEAKDASIIQIIDTAVAPERRSKPRRTVIVGLAAFMGLVFAVVCALSLDAVARKFNSPGEVAQLKAIKSLLSWR